MQFNGTVKKTGFSILLIFLLSGCLSQSKLPVRFDLETHHLPNGLRVLLVPDSTVPVVSYQTWYRVGSVDEGPGKTGMAHLFEHLMFRGTEKFGPREFFRRLETKGAEVNAVTSRDYTVFYQTFIPELLDLVIEMESDRMRNLKLDSRSLEIEKRVVLEERHLRIESFPGAKAEEALWALAFQVHPYRWPTIGVPKDILGLKTEDLKNFYDLHYQPSNATVVVVGDFNPKTALDRIQAAYGSYPRKPIPVRAPQSEPEQTAERRIRLKDQVSNTLLIRGYPIVSAHHEDSYSLDVLAAILLEGRDSRAHLRLVDELGLAESVSGIALTPAFSGLMTLSVSLKSRSNISEVEEVLDGLTSELKNVAPTSREVDRAVQKLTMELVEHVSSPHGLGHLLGTVQTVFGSPDRFRKDLEKYFRVRPQDVQRVAMKYLDPNRRTTVVVEPEVGATK